MIKPLTAIVVDDEPLARKELRMLLAEHPEIQVVGEAQSVEAAVELVEATEPDVVFLDIQMPRHSGFELLDRVEATFKTVFVTAHDAFAIRAFEVNALDYLLKPVLPKRLRLTVERLVGSEPPEPRQLKPLEYGDRLFITSGQKQFFLRIERIKAILAAGDYSTVRTVEGGDLLVLKSLAEWEERLPETHFARVHRSTIVNIDYVDRIEKWFNSSHAVFLKGETEPVQMSRRYASRLRQQS